MIKDTATLALTKQLLKTAMSNMYDMNKFEGCTPNERIQLLEAIQLIEQAIDKLP